MFCFLKFPYHTVKVFRDAPGLGNKRRDRLPDSVLRKCIQLLVVTLKGLAVRRHKTVSSGKAGWCIRQSPKVTKLIHHVTPIFFFFFCCMHIYICVFLFIYSSLYAYIFLCCLPEAGFLYYAVKMIQLSECNVGCRCRFEARRCICNLHASGAMTACLQIKMIRMKNNKPKNAWILLSFKLEIHFKLEVNNAVNSSKRKMGWKMWPAPIAQNVGKRNGRCRWVYGVIHIHAPSTNPPVPLLLLRPPYMPSVWRTIYRREKRGKMRSGGGHRLQTWKKIFF